MWFKNKLKNSIEDLWRSGFLMSQCKIHLYFLSSVHWLFELWVLLGLLILCIYTFLLGLQVNVKDARFQAMYTSHLFNLDPSDPNFKKTKAMEKILEEKARQREQKEQELTQAVKKKESEIQKESHKRSIDPALSMLIKSVKNKTEQFQARKKQKVK